MFLDLLYVYILLHLNVLVLIKLQEITIFGPSDRIISKVLVSEGMEVGKFQPMYIRGRGIIKVCNQNSLSSPLVSFIIKIKRNCIYVSLLSMFL